MINNKIYIHDTYLLCTKHTKDNCVNWNLLSLLKDCHWLDSRSCYPVCLCVWRGGGESKIDIRVVHRDEFKRLTCIPKINTSSLEIQWNLGAGLMCPD